MTSSHSIIYSTHHNIIQCGGAPDDPSRQKAWDLPIVERNNYWENLLRVADQVSIEPICWPRQRERAGLGSMLCQFRRLGHFWTPRVLGLPLPLEWAPMFVFLILAVAAGGWTACKYSAGRFPRHSAMNYVVTRALQKAGLLSVLEPPGLYI